MRQIKARTILQPYNDFWSASGFRSQSGYTFVDCTRSRYTLRAVFNCPIFYVPKPPRTVSLFAGSNVPAPLVREFFCLFGKTMRQSRHFIVRVSNTASEMQKLKQICDRRGMTQIAMISRLAQWLAKQDDTTQHALLAGSSDLLAKNALYHLLLQNLSAGHKQIDGGDNAGNLKVSKPG